MKPVLTYPSYDQIHQGVADITLQFTRDGYTPDFIIGLTRGGLVPAVMMSHMTDDTPVIPVSYSSTEGNGDNKNHTNILHTIDGKRNILIVDDICDSGRTLFELKGFYSKYGHNIRTATLYYKENNTFTPDYYWQYVPSDGPWIIFPFER